MPWARLMDWWEIALGNHRQCSRDLRPIDTYIHGCDGAHVPVADVAIEIGHSLKQFLQQPDERNAPWVQCALLRGGKCYVLLWLPTLSHSPVMPKPGLLYQSARTTYGPTLL